MSSMSGYRPTFCPEDFCFSCLEARITELEEKISDDVLEMVEELQGLRKQIKAADPTLDMCHRHNMEAYEDGI